MKLSLNIPTRREVLRLIPEPIDRDGIPNIEVEQFSDISIACILTGNSTKDPTGLTEGNQGQKSTNKWKITWHSKDMPPSNQQVSNQAVVASNDFFSVTRNLSIYSVRAANGGNFTCNAAGPTDVTLSKSFLLAIKPQHLSNVTGMISSI